MTRKVPVEKTYFGIREKPGGKCRVCVGTPNQISALSSEEPNRPLIRIFKAGMGSSANNDLEIHPESDLNETSIGKAQPLRERWDLAQHSRVFDWGAYSPASLQLALAIIVDFWGDDRIHEIRIIYDSFCRVVIATLPLDRWVLTSRNLNFCLNVELLPPIGSPTTRVRKND